MNKTVDARGLACPQPVIRAKEALKEMKDGTLEILVSEEIAVQNLMKLGNYSNMKPSSEKLGEKEFKVVFHVDGDAAETAVAGDGPETCQPDAVKKGLVAVVSSDRMGDGDDALGHILMKSFLYTLTKLEAYPETVLFYNGGVRLTTEGSESIGDLKDLEAQGVEILSCGTCLDYYGLKEQLRVGGVTNMYEIAEKMAGASAVIRP